MNYIPQSRHILIEKICSSMQFNQAEEREFKAFAEILNAYIHHQAQKELEDMKYAYTCFNPNLENDTSIDPEKDEQSKQAKLLSSNFEKVLLKANYQELTIADIERALNQSSLVPVNTSVDLNEYETIKMFYRGSSKKEVKLKKYFKTKVLKFDNYNTVAVLLHIKEHSYFENQKIKIENLNFTPGKVYLYLYKNIPHHDLELLFPNVKISMNLKDQLLLVIPALGAAIPLVIKVLPSLALLVGVIAFVVFGWDLGGKFSTDVNESKAIYPLLVAVLSTSVALGGFAVRQYLKYKSKRLEFLKKVTDVLFFKSMDVCQGVLNAIIDKAEEEESKEMLLVYSVLLASNGSMSKSELQNKAQNWLSKNFEEAAEVNFSSAVTNLLSLTTNVSGTNQEYAVIKEEGEKYSAMNLAQSKKTLDYIWDNIFEYN